MGVFILAWPLKVRYGVLLSLEYLQAAVWIWTFLVDSRPCNNYHGDLSWSHARPKPTKAHDLD